MTSMLVSPSVPAARRAPGPLASADDALLERTRALLQVTRPSASWWVELVGRLDHIGDRIWEHRATVEGTHGLHRQIVDEAPRLAPHVSRLERDHDDIETRLAEVRTLVARSSGDPRRAPVAITAVADLLDRLERHQRRAREVLHQAYQVDLGGE
jgi:hypothetical protein